MQCYNNVGSQPSISRCAWLGVGVTVSPLVSPRDIQFSSVQFQDEIEQEMIWMIDVIHYDQHLVNKVDFQG